MMRLVVAVVALALCAAAALGAYSMVGHAFDLVRLSVGGFDRPVSGDTTRVVFRVEPGQSAAEIGTVLEARGLIRSARVFRVLVERDGVGNRLAAGEYELSPSQSTAEVVATLAGGRVRRGDTLTVPEGWRAEEIAWRLEERAAGTGGQFLDIVYAGLPALSGGAALEDFGLPRDASLEGLLFPDTYEWPAEAEGSVRALADRMVAQLVRRFDAARRQQATEVGLTPWEAVILASVVERETALAEERPLVAAVYHNRLARGMPLQADPTVQFALAAPRVPAPTDVLWKRELATQDLATPSPYNTYQRVGLPSGPICSPGQAALDAVLRPATTEALYFVARGDGSHVFARTLDEHLTNVQRYR